MSVLAQSGFGRGDKIEQGLAAGIIDGVIMSPCDETKDRLENGIRQLRREFPDAQILFDPQFYLATLSAPRDKHLGEYDYYANNSGLGRTQFSPSLIRRYTQNCINYQYNEMGDELSYLLSPTILFDGFSDYWSQVAINMAVESVDHYATLDSPPPLLISLVISETALQSLVALEEYLDALTELDVEGFYIIIRRNANFLTNAMDPHCFGQFLYMCHVLRNINNYVVVVGYSDWHSFILESAGATFTACGWYQNLRYFSLSRFLPQTGGRRPRKRYSSSPLLSCPFIMPEMEDIHLAGFLSNVLTGAASDSILMHGPASGEPNWTDVVSCLTHWTSLHSLSTRISNLNSPVDRIQESLNIINGAFNLYNFLIGHGINFDTMTGPQHLFDWQMSINEFRATARI